ncbi:MAG TPA: rhomboid family intramembrane serine protease [Bryobacteraceae bacterium]|nr:rhomboid family intramembrane serine protease [Bryobacteraceae bacterium]
MAYSTRPRSSGISYSGYFPNGVKWLLISNIALFVLYFFAARVGAEQYFLPFSLIPGEVLHHLAIWQLATYMFLHDPNGFSHILFNMLTLWMFGADLERGWGTRKFLKYYFLCGIGAGISVVIANLLFSNTLYTRTIGASGAIYGLLLAFGMLYPNTQVLFSFLFPMKAKYFVMILGAIAFMSSFGASGGGISHVAHLGGMIFGYGYLRSRKSRFEPIAPIRRWYQEYKLQRAKKKFQVYLRKRESKHDRFVN